jgi:drug/metabolite transporter (DMT)-like permease
VGEIVGVVAAVLSSALGGTTIAATRFIVGALDPSAIGAFRFGIGFILLLPIAFAAREPWPIARDWPGVFALGILYFGLFPLLFNWSLAFTTSARGALALSTAPLLTMVAGAGLGVEPLTTRKTVGVVIATAGVAIALLSGLAEAPNGAWKGDLLMVAAALCMSLYNIWSKSFIRRSAPMPYATMGMAVGGVCLTTIAWVRDAFEPVARFHSPEWLAILYLGIFGGALLFFLWAFALARSTPTQVAISVTVNPIVASIVAAVLLGEQLSWNVFFGLVTVFLGIWIAMADYRVGSSGEA